MGDLALGYGVLAGLALGLFLGTARLSRGFSPWACDLAGAAVVAALFLYIRTLWFDVRVAAWLPFANLIVVGNWLPLFSAVLAALVWRRCSTTPLRQQLALAQLAAAGCLAAVYPLLGSVPHCGDRWDKLGTCLQTTPTPARRLPRRRCCGVMGSPPASRRWRRSA